MPAHPPAYTLPQDPLPRVLEILDEWRDILTAGNYILANYEHKWESRIVDLPGPSGFLQSHDTGVRVATLQIHLHSSDPPAIDVTCSPVPPDPALRNHRVKLPLPQEVEV